MKKQDHFFWEKTVSKPSSSLFLLSSWLSWWPLKPPREPRPRNPALSNCLTSWGSLDWVIKAEKTSCVSWTVPLSTHDIKSAPLALFLLNALLPLNALFPKIFSMQILTFLTVSGSHFLCQIEIWSLLNFKESTSPRTSPLGTRLNCSPIRPSKSSSQYLAVWVLGSFITHRPPSLQASSSQSGLTPSINCAGLAR